MRIRKHQEPRGWAVHVAAGILRPALVAATRRQWLDAEKIPAEGGCVIALNHVSHVDPLMSAHLVHNLGRVPLYLAKSGLFRNRALGGFLTAAGQIPVERLSADAVGAYDAAVRAIETGGCVVVYPEGTITRDPDLWPMRGSPALPASRSPRDARSSRWVSGAPRTSSRRTPRVPTSSRGARS
ncbi:1-acyl-sn-glycerol-3-phosphate acyltransferase [Nocardioides sp.]|uniref:lysophospholipid acyltransferase family protein n=1 Tax=Nocardioides sp. TaxID=35761 RepID=UPI002734ED9D|nr:lysophospholipid acyltransferase family protein [Nocardioides sp.]MDP3890522.1 lysophospholipid acyltransferase family protein [Nocardioides sp.]